MAWQGILEHDEVVERFRRALTRGRLASTFLFVGPPGVGKRSFADALAQTLLCQTVPEAEMAPCGSCPGCVQVLAGTHPDLVRIKLPPGKSTIPLELLIGDDQHRMRQGLCYDLSLRPFMGGRKVAIIEDADDLKQPEGSNCLLKTLEEPPPRSVLILIGSSAEKQLPTIRSRSQIVRFSPLSTETVARLLVEKNLIADPAEAERLASRSGGSVQQAIDLADPDLWAFRENFLAALASPRFNSVELSRTVIAFVDSAGKEASKRRDRSRQLIIFALEFYRQLARTMASGTAVDDATLAATIQQALHHWVGDEQTAASCVDRCETALAHVDRNANQNTLLEAWLDDVATLQAGQPLPV